MTYHRKKKIKHTKVPPGAKEIYFFLFKKLGELTIHAD